MLVMLKILQARLQQYMNHELPDVQVGFRKGRGTKDQIANICWIIKTAREFQKNIYFCFIDYTKVFGCVDHNKLWKFWKRWEYQSTWPDSWEICMQLRKQHLELDMEQQTGSTLEKEYIKSIYCHPAYLTYMQSTSCKCHTGWSTSWNRDFQDKYQYLRYADDTTLRAEREEEIKSLLMKVKEENAKVGLKLNI